MFKVLMVGNEKGFYPFVYEQAAALEKQGIKIEYYGIVGRGALGYLKNLKALKTKIKEINPDLIHAHYGLSGLLANLQRRVTVVTTYHGSDINIYSDRQLSKISIVLSKYNIFVSERLRKTANTKHKCKVIPCGIDLNLCADISKDSARNKFGILDSQLIVLFAGAFDNQVKNSRLAKEAVSLLPNVELIELKGYTRQQVVELMYAADVLLMTSFTEGSPQVIKEAMACNKPIVSTNVGDVEWVLGDTEGCYICSYDTQDCADKIMAALEFSKNKGQTDGRKRIEELGLDNNIVAKKIVEIYTKVISKN